MPHPVGCGTASFIAPAFFKPAMLSDAEDKAKGFLFELFHGCDIIPTRRGLNNSAYVILLFVSLSVLIIRCICIILCQNALVIILLSRLITRIIPPWIIWKCYVCIIAYLTSNCNMLFENLHAIFTKSVQTSCDLGNSLL